MLGRMAQKKLTSLQNAREIKYTCRFVANFRRILIEKSVIRLKYKTTSLTRINRKSVAIQLRFNYNERNVGGKKHVTYG